MYWRNDEKIGLSQTQVSVPSTNGRSYTGKAGTGGSRVDFEIPPNVKFLDGKNSYLQFKCQLSLPAATDTNSLPTRLQLDPSIGGQSLIRNIRIYSGSRGTLLEEISDYNTKVQMEYSYNQDDSLRKMRALKEGAMISSISNRGTLGTSVSNLIDTRTNPYVAPIAAAPAARNFDNTDFVEAKCSLPLHTGIFADSEKLFPVMMTQGLYIEIDLEDAARCIKQLDSVNRHRRMQQNPLVQGSDAAGTAFAADGTALAGTDFTEIFLTKDNNMLTVDDCPFVKGEVIGICSKTDPAATARLTIGGAAITDGDVVITDITLDGGFVKLTVTSFRNNEAGAGAAQGGVAITTRNFIVYSRSVDKRTQRNDDQVQVIAPITAYQPSYTLSDLQIVCQKIECDPRYEEGMICKLREGGSIDFDILSATNIKHSLLSSNRNATVNLDSSATRAKSCLIVPTDASVYNTAELISSNGNTYDEERLTEDGRLHSIRSGQVGIIDKLSSYQFVLDDKLVPSRPVDVSKINGGKSISAQPLIELEKALLNAEIIPRSFCDYNRNFVIGRAYALDGGVANLNNRSNQLQLFYNESTVAGVDEPPTKDKLLMCYIYHVRRITIKGDSVRVSL
tara:strand:- start:3191 stop:5050 length:1860 start_codon:yes stop_codon:yes gene_type:complete